MVNSSAFWWFNPNFLCVNPYWLVVSTPLKNMKVNGKDYPQNIMENKIHVPNHQPAYFGTAELLTQLGGPGFCNPPANAGSWSGALKTSPAMVEGVYRADGNSRGHGGTPSHHPCYFRNFHCKASILGCPRLWKSLNDHLPHGKPWEDGSKPWEMGLSQNWLHHFFHRFLIISPMNWCHFGVYRIPQFFRKSRHGGPILPRFWKYSKT